MAARRPTSTRSMYTAMRGCSSRSVLKSARPMARHRTGVVARTRSSVQQAVDEQRQFAEEVAGLAVDRAAADLDDGAALLQHEEAGALGSRRP